jgi:hypothetical protein
MVRLSSAASAGRGSGGAGGADGATVDSELVGVA